MIPNKIVPKAFICIGIRKGIFVKTEAGKTTTIKERIVETTKEILKNFRKLPVKISFKKPAKRKGVNERPKNSNLTDIW